jgi:hypothetical protein
MIETILLQIPAGPWAEGSSPSHEPKVFCKDNLDLENYGSIM